MLKPEHIPFIVFTVPPLLLLMVMYVARPGTRRLLSAFIGGFAFAILHISWDTVASYARWWYYPFTSDTHAPFLWYTGRLCFGATTALIGWRIQRRFGMRGSLIFLVLIAVLGVVNDFVGASAAQAGILIVFGAGVIPLIADSACSGTNALVAQGGMRLAGAPAKADRLKGCPATVRGRDE